MARLDMYEKRESGMDRYLAQYGFHFSKPMYEWAVSMMKDRNGNKMQPVDKATFDSVMNQNGVKIDAKGYDGPYVWSSAKADFAGSSLPNDAMVAKFVGDYLGDRDGYDEIAFTRFYADCIAKGCPIIWEDML